MPHSEPLRDEHQGTVAAHCCDRPRNELHFLLVGAREEHNQDQRMAMGGAATVPPTMGAPEHLMNVIRMLVSQIISQKMKFKPAVFCLKKQISPGASMAFGCRAAPSRLETSGHTFEKCPEAVPF